MTQIYIFILPLWVETVRHLRWYCWEYAYAGVEEGGGAAAAQEGGAPYVEV